MTRSIALLAVVLVLASGTLVQAQSIAFGFSSGGGGHHHHHCRPGYSFGFYAPPPVYVYPRVYAAPPPVTYVYPYPTAAVAPAPIPVAAAPAPNPPANTAWKTKTQPIANALPASQRQVTIIRNPARSGGAVAFVVDEENEIALDEGQSHSLLSGSGYTVEFDRGGDFGAARKTLGPGVYEFTVTDRGWDLVNQNDLQRTATRPTVKRNELPKVR